MHFWFTNVLVTLLLYWFCRFHIYWNSFWEWSNEDLKLGANLAKERAKNQSNEERGWFNLWDSVKLLTSLESYNEKEVFYAIEFDILSFPNWSYLSKSEFVWVFKSWVEVSTLQLLFQVAHPLVFQPYLELQRSNWDDSKCYGKLRQISTTFKKEYLAD